MAMLHHAPRPPNAHCSDSSGRSALDYRTGSDGCHTSTRYTPDRVAEIGHQSPIATPHFEGPNARGPREGRANVLLLLLSASRSTGCSAARCCSHRMPRASMAPRCPTARGRASAHARWWRCRRRRRDRIPRLLRQAPSGVRAAMKLMPSGAWAAPTGEATGGEAPMGGEVPSAISARHVSQRGAVARSRLALHSGATVSVGADWTSCGGASTRATTCESHGESPRCCACGCGCLRSKRRHESRRRRPV